MNIRTATNIALAFLIGSVAGAYLDRYYLFGPHRVSLDVEPFSTRLMENASMLAVLKMGDITCARKSLESTITIDIEGAGFYRAYASKDSQTLQRLEKSISFAKDTLRSSEQTKSEKRQICP